MISVALKDIANSESNNRMDFDEDRGGGWRKMGNLQMTMWGAQSRRRAHAGEESHRPVDTVLLLLVTVNCMIRYGNCSTIFVGIMSLS